MPAGRSSAFGKTPERSAGDRGPLRADPGGPAPSRAGAIALVSASCVSPALSAPRASRPLPSASRDRRQDLWLRQIHPRRQARSEARAKGASGHRPDPSPQHPRAALLPPGDANVLKHPTLDRLHALGLYGMARLSPISPPPATQRICRTPTGSPCSSTGRRHGGGTNA